MPKKAGKLREIYRGYRSADITLHFTGEPYRGRVGKHWKRVKVKLGKKTLVELPELDLYSLKSTYMRWLKGEKRRPK